MAPAVLFDLFETLMTEMQDSSAPYPPPWGAPGIELGMGHDCFRRGWTTRKARRMTSTLSYEDALEEICRECGVDPPMDKIHALNESRQAARLRAFLAVPQPVLMMLEELRRQGFRIVVVSNCSVEEAAHFEASPLSGRVDDVVWSFREGVQKPDPQIFLRACEAARAVPTETVFVGDGSFDELRGAGEVGIMPIWASWFTHGWPAHLAAQRRTEVGSLGIREAKSPDELLQIVLTRSTPT